jgi:hypothetical protein
MTVILAGFPFLVLAHSDLRMLRAPGVYALARRQGAQRTILYVAHGEDLAAAYGGQVWVRALQAGMDEALVNLDAVERLDRLQIADRVVRAFAPELNERAANAHAARTVPVGLRR